MLYWLFLPSICIVLESMVIRGQKYKAYTASIGIRQPEFGIQQCKTNEYHTSIGNLISGQRRYQQNIDIAQLSLIYGRM
jgi:hypothetical protein